MKFTRTHNFTEGIMPLVLRLSIVLFIIPLILVSCSGDPVSTAKSVVDKQIKGFSEGYLEMTDFKKVDGVKREDHGMEVYQLTYEVEVKVIKDGGWINLNGDGTLVGKSNNPFYSEVNPFSVFENQCEGEFIMRKCKNTQIQKGQKFKGRSMMFLEKHDNGWVAN